MRRVLTFAIAVALIMWVGSARGDTVADYEVGW